MSRATKQILFIAAFLCILNGLLCVLAWNYSEQLRNITSLPFLIKLHPLQIVILITLFFVATFLLILIFFSKKMNMGILSHVKKTTESTENPNESVSPAESQLTPQMKDRLTSIFAQAHEFEGKYTTKNLPAYVIAGLNGSGKTSLLLNSGLTFPLQIPPAEIIEHLCTWWFSDEAVFIELGYPNHEVQSELWKQVLNLLIKQKRSINGLIICLNASDFFDNPEEKLKQIMLVRRTLDNQLKAIGMRYPIYLVVTQLDKLQGFTEFFNHLDLKEQQQSWGIGFTDEARDKVQWTTLIEQRFHDLLQRLRIHKNDLLSRELQTSARAISYLFPEQFACLQKPLAHFISEVFVSNNYYEIPFLRGIFFVSSCQQGATINPLADIFKKQLALECNEYSQQLVSQRAYFTKTLFSKFILKEQNIKHANIRCQRRINLKRYLTNFLIIFCGLACIGLWVNSYNINLRALVRVQNTLSDYQGIVNSTQPGMTDYYTQYLQALNKLELVNHTFDEEAQQWRAHLGLFVGDDIVKASRKAYERVALQQFVPRLQAALGRQLQATTGLDLYQTLSVYLMLGMPQHRNDQQIIQWFSNYWQNIEQQSTNQHAILMQLLNEYLNQEEYQKLPLNTEWIESARERLWQFSIAQLGYFYIASQATTLGNINQNNTILDISNITRVYNVTNEQLRIPLLYTAYGLTNYYSKLRDNALKILYGSDWVLGEQYQIKLLDKSTLANQIDRIYYSNYISFWSNLISSLDIVDFTSIQHATQVIGILEQANSPMQQIIRTIAENTTLATDSKTTNNTQVIQAAEVINPIFSELNQLVRTPKEGYAPIVNIDNSLNSLNKTLNFILNSDNPQHTTFEFVVGYFNGEVSPISQLKDIAATKPLVVNQWLNQIADQTWFLILADAADYIDQQWNEQIYRPYHQLISNHYPFTKNASEQISLIDFTNFFAPESSMDMFFTNYLKPFVNTSQSPWAWIILDNQSIGNSAISLKYLDNFKQIQKRFFNQNEKKIQINYSLKPTDLDATVKVFNLQINDQSIQYKHGPEFYTDFRWPGNNSNQTANIQFIDFKGREFNYNATGPWALFKLLDNSHIRSVNSDKLYQIKFTVDSYSATYNLLADRSYNPFDLNLLHNFYLPEEIID